MRERGRKYDLVIIWCIPCLSRTLHMWQPFSVLLTLFLTFEILWHSILLWEVKPRQDLHTKWLNVKDLECIVKYIDQRYKFIVSWINDTGRQDSSIWPLSTSWGVILQMYKALVRPHLGIVCSFGHQAIGKMLFSWKGCYQDWGAWETG